MSSECNNVKLAIRNDKSKVVCAMCKQCLITANHDVCVLNYVNDMNSYGKKQKANVSNTKNQKKQNPKVMKPKKENNESSASESHSDCSMVIMAHVLLTLRTYKQSVSKFHFFSWQKFLGSVRFGNGHVAAILGFGDLQWGNILITRVYFVEGLGHNLFSIRQFCDSNLEVAFRNNTCFVRNLGGVDLLKGNRTTKLYTINLHEMASASPICLMARATSTKSVYNRRTKKSMETMNVTFDELSAMDFGQSSSKLGLQSMTSGQISSGLDLTYALSTITQKPTERELDLLFEAMHDDFIGGQPSAAPRTTLAAQAPQVLQTPMATTTTADTAPIPTNSSSQATNFLNTS
ncbi:hypothetical protein Tco_0551341 [Tanacetum coccineum]